MDKLYEFEKYPENVRQIGEPEEKGRIYFEDYVITYMKRFFGRSAEKVILIYLGKKGKGECDGCYFIYGAMELDFDFMDTEEVLSEEQWSEIFSWQETYFPDSDIMGWGMGIRMETRALKNRMKEFHKKYFSDPQQICYICNQGEETKQVYSFDGLSFKKKRGYMVYYGKNPQMQNFMLRGRQKESSDASCTDSVMANVRAVIKKNEEKHQEKKTITAAAVVFFVCVFTAGGFFLLQGNRKLEKLEETLSIVSNRETIFNTEEQETVEPQEEKTEEQQEKTKEQQGKTEGQQEKKEEQQAGKKEEQAEKTEEQQEKTEEQQAEKKEEQQEKTEEQQAEKKEEQAEKKEERQEKTEEQAEKKDKTKQKKKKRKTKQTANLYHSYIVQKGDTLSQIVWREYRDLSKVSLIKKRNKIQDANQIQAGQRLILPVY